MPNNKVTPRYCLLAGFMLGIFFCFDPAFAEAPKESPLIINGDNVEYSADSKEVTATGNIEIIYKGAKLTCNRLKVNMQTKVGVAEGNARLDDARGVVTGNRIVYDFANKTGVIYDADFRANPYFGKAKKVQRLSEEEFVARNGYFSTCNLDRPHYRFVSKKLSIYPQDKIQAEKNTLYLWSVPLVYFPRFNYSVKEPIMHVQVEPGKRKDWGLYLLNTWRYNLTDNANLRVFLDYRQKMGLGEGFDLNYLTPGFGKSDFKFYYSNEDADNLPAGSPTEFERYFIRWRHRWTISPRTNLIAELYKIKDDRRKFENNPAPPFGSGLGSSLDAHSLLQDYFFREYEKDSQPLSYILFHHAFNYSSLDVIFQKRTNHWFDQLEKLPEISYNLPSIQLANTPLYFENSTQLATYNKKASMTPVDPNIVNTDVTMTRLDTINRISLPMKISFIQFKPFVSSRQTFYDRGANGQTGIVRTIFYSGADLSTKFFGIYDVKSNFLGLDVNGLRHIITPSIGYLYTHDPTIPVSNLRQIDSVDAITRGNTASLSLSNKLQTKRHGTTVDMLDFLITTDYVLDPKSGTNQNSILSDPGNRLHSQFSDVFLKLKFLPYSWLRLESEATYEHSNFADINYNRFSLANYSLSFDFGPERSFSIGQRYQRKGPNEVTAHFLWRLTPKWKFGIYERYNLKDSPTLAKGAQEQEYTLTRDLHCWDLDITLNQKESTGSTIFFVFRLKAFPETEFGFDQKMSTSKSGTQ